MNLNVTGHQLEITPALRDYVQAKLERVTRHFDQVIDAHVVLSATRIRQRAEVTLHLRGKILRGAGRYLAAEVAFTGAVERRKGKFEYAHKGTLFLDEIGELAPALQVKLLRVLQEGEFHRLGGEQPVKVSVRVVSATNKDLPGEVASLRRPGPLPFRPDEIHRRLLEWARP